MIQASPVIPQQPNSVAIAVSSGSFPLQVYYSQTDLEESHQYQHAGAVAGPDVIEIGGLTPGSWYRLLLIDSAGDPGAAFLLQVPTPQNAFVVDLLRESIKEDVIVNGRSTCFRLRIEARNPVGLPDAGIFLYWNPGAGEPAFHAVCKPTDIEEYPLNGTDIGYIRKSYVDVLERNRDTLEEEWAIIVIDVNSLLENLNRNYSLDRDAFIRLTGDLPPSELVSYTPSSSGSSL